MDHRSTPCPDARIVAPPPLLAEAEIICAEAAGLTWSEWGIFLTAVEP